MPRPLVTLPLVALMALASPGAGMAQDGAPLDLSLEHGLSAPDDDPLRIEMTRGVIEPSEIALATFHDEGGAKILAPAIQAVIAGPVVLHHQMLALQIFQQQAFLHLGRCF